MARRHPSRSLVAADAAAVQMVGRGLRFNPRPNPSYSQYFRGPGMLENLWDPGQQPAEDTFYHGSPVRHLAEDASNVKSLFFLTKFPSVAKRYAQGQVLGTGRTPAGVQKQPTVYTLNVYLGPVFDLRLPAHQKMYNDVIIPQYNASIPEDPGWDMMLLPKYIDPFETDDYGNSRNRLVSTHTLLPQYSFASRLQRALQPRGFVGVLIDEGTTEWSLCMFPPVQGVSVVDMTSVEEYNKTRENPLASFHSARQEDPSEFVRYGSEYVYHGAQPILMVYGVPADGGGSRVQSIRFPVEDWTPAAAKSWLAKHGYSVRAFEPAVNE